MTTNSGYFHNTRRSVFKSIVWYTKNILQTGLRIYIGNDPYKINFLDYHAKP